MLKSCKKEIFLLKSISIFNLKSTFRQINTIKPEAVSSVAFDVQHFIVEVAILVAQNKIKIQMAAKSRNESSGCQKYTKYTAAASQSLSQYEAAA